LEFAETEIENQWKDVTTELKMELDAKLTVQALFPAILAQEELPSVLTYVQKLAEMES